ncbi:hypothetical protein [Actinoplanes sp. NPDC049681]|uniref:hypothetical protein n=1 Tax=Actinoplanes sp. NPDC049681 TaxID=3363905 RepID=UPI003795437C
MHGEVLSILDTHLAELQAIRRELAAARPTGLGQRRQIAAEAAEAARRCAGRLELVLDGPAKEQPDIACRGLVPDGPAKKQPDIARRGVIQDGPATEQRGAGRLGAVRDGRPEEQRAGRGRPSRLRHRDGRRPATSVVARSGDGPLPCD